MIWLRVATDKLLEHIKKTCLEQKGKLILPAFSLGRTREILFMLNHLELEGRLPDLPYYVDSPLSIKITNAVKSYLITLMVMCRTCLKKIKDVFSFKGVEIY